VGGEGHHIHAKRLEINGDLARRLNGVHMQNAAFFMNDRGNIGNRLDHPGFVIGEHDRNQRRRFKVIQRRLQRTKIKLAVSGDGEPYRPRPGGAEDGIMLDGGN